MKKGSMLTALLLAMVMCFSSFAAAETVVDDLVLTPDVQTQTGSEETGFTLANYQQQQEAMAMYSAMVSTTTLADFYAQLESAYYADEAVRALFTVEWTNALYAHADELYALEDPADEDAYNLYEEVSALIAWVFGAEDARAFATVTTGTWSGARLAANASVEYNFVDNSTVTFRADGHDEYSARGSLVVSAGATLTINGQGCMKRGTGHIRPLIYVEEGGKLIIIGESKEKPFVIDGAEELAEAALIYSAGTVELNNVVVKDGKNRALSGYGGGLFITATGSLSMENATITENTATTVGGGFHSAGPVSAKNCTISKNRAMVTETGDGVVNKGRGAGFNLSGEAAVATFENVVVEDNACFYYGGGGQVQSSASLTMIGGSFKNNKSLLHGAGALHVTGNATFIMESGTMEGNTAQTVGGAIHSSYSCTIQLKGGTIQNNTAYGRGGGVHINTGGNITLGNELTISGNKVYADATGSGGIVNDTGDSWSDIQRNGPNVNNGYGGGVLIDSGTCQVSGATVSGNQAEVGGGGIALVMLNAADGNKGRINELKVVEFKMTSGSITNNETNGNGAGVYLMSNRLSENLSEEQIALLDDKSLLTSKPHAIISGGEVSDNNADANGGGMYLDTDTEFYMSGTALFDANEAKNGGAVYIAKGTADISGGTMKANAATENGGAIYVSGNVTMSAGMLGGNTSADGNSSVNGGAVYVDSGNFSMSDGSLNHNAATQNGGAVYMGGGNFTMEHGKANNNSATQGGAVYLKGDSDTTFIMQSGEMNENNASDDGGAVYATNGKLYFGLLNCQGSTDDQAKHTALGTGRHHPLIQDNTAEDCGGGIAISEKGVVHFYCGNATGNDALYKGVGKNVFMMGGDFYLYDGANIGVPRDPDLVIVQGTLHNECQTKKYIDLFYYKSNTDTETAYIGLIEEYEFMNLPEGEYFWTADEGYTFVGWTAKGEVGEQRVRNKNEYLPSGDTICAVDAPTYEIEVDGETQTVNQIVYDGEQDDELHLYAIWAPIENEIHYIDSMESDFVEHAPIKYELQKQENATINIPAILKPGYAVVGWYIYQDEEQNANWGLEPLYTDENNKVPSTLNLTEMKTVTEPEAQYKALSAPGADLVLDVGDMRFGNITLVAVFEPQYGTLTINKAGAVGTDNANYVFHLEGTRTSDGAEISMDVVIGGNGSATINQLPVGTYTVSEDEGWSWRYTNTEVTGDEVESAEGVQVVVTGPEDENELTFTNNRDKTKWLDGEDTEENQFTIPNAA